jgi:glycosyltransferase involved in cell wall biosynthesis
MACEKPVVAFNIPAPVSDIIKNDETGYLIEEMNVPHMARAMMNLLKDDDKRRLFGIQARRIILKYYDINIIKDKWIKLLNDINLKNKNIR